jgi:hypothetical protein
MDKTNLTTNLKELTEIAEWFDEQENVDVEEGLKKVKTAAELIKKSKLRLKAIENEFEEIKKEIEEVTPDIEMSETIVVSEETNVQKDISKDQVEPDDFPF